MAHKSEKLLHLWWSWPSGLTDYYLCLISVNRIKVMQQAWSEDKQAVFSGRVLLVNKLILNNILNSTGNQWRKSGRLRANRGDLIIKRASQFWTRWSVVRSMSAIPYKSELQWSRWLDTRAVASNFALSRSRWWQIRRNFARLLICVSGRWKFCGKLPQDSEQI